jgi:hypothetical protein
MQRWEYKRIQRNIMLDYELNELGERGWEMVTMFVSNPVLILRLQTS